MNELITIEQPNGNAEVAQKMHDLVVHRTREVQVEYDEIMAKLTPEHFAETKEKWTELKKMDGELKTISEGIERAALAYAQATGLLTQVNASRKQLAALYKNGWALFTKLRDADKPAPERFEYIVEICAEAAAMDKLAAKWAKDGVEFRYRRVKDGESAKVAKMFEDKEAK